MKILKKNILIIAVVALIAGCMGWRLWSHTLADVISVDTNSVSNIACSASIHSVSDGTSRIESYTLDSSSRGEDDFLEIMEILNSTSYRQNFRNLLPWPTTAVAADGATHSATVTLVWGTAADEWCTINFLDNKTICLSLRVKDGFLIYHPTDRMTLDRLVDYIQLHGTPN